MVKACEFCRRRKIKCDTIKPICSPCRRNNRSCVYHNGPRKQRPSAALINHLRDENAALESTLLRLKTAGDAERAALLSSLSVTEGRVSQTGRSATTPSRPSREFCLDPYLEQQQQQQPPDLQQRIPDITEALQETSASREGLAPISGVDIDEVEDNDDGVDGAGPDIRDEDHDHDASCSSDEDIDETATWYPTTTNKTHQDGDAVIGSTSLAQASSSPSQRAAPDKPGDQQAGASSDALRYQLIANAALERQREHRLRSMTTIRGTPAELALHLLDLHWSRQHHTFLLTYRPTFMRELVDGGPYCSDLLLHAVFACASKFSERIDLRSDPNDPGTAGQHFFLRCDDILLREGLLSKSQIPTIIALIMLGSTFIARGRTSKGWLYTGYALRMVYDLGLHVDAQEVNIRNAEEVEIRRRVFWGAFVCEKLQSLYLGRPPTIRLRDARVSLDFMDTYEELEQWAPYQDPLLPDASHVIVRSEAPSAFSVSVFQQLCHLSKIMTRIINKIYFVGATAWKTSKEISPLDDALQAWYTNLPPHLPYEPWSKTTAQSSMAVAPNRIILLTTYHSLVILLHRPFIATPAGGVDRHHSTAATNEGGGDQPIRLSAYSWKRCTATARNITSLALSYRSIYPLRRSNYLLSYAVYVACTIHVLNVASLSSGSDKSAHAESSSLLAASLGCLDELAVPNSGAANTARLIRKLMASKGVQEMPMPAEFQNPAPSHLSDHLWQFSNASPTYDILQQTQPFQEIWPSGQDLLFGFMNESFTSPPFGMGESGF